MADLPRSHKWQQKPTESTEYFEFFCPICGLDYTRKQADGKVCAVDRWKMSLSCIRPVPQMVSLAELETELRENKVRFYPIALGLPGNWRVGFYGNGGLIQYPQFEVKAPLTLEHAFAMLLKWLRVRDYNPELDHRFCYFYSLDRRILHPLLED